MKRTLLTLTFAALLGCGAGEEPTNPEPNPIHPSTPTTPGGLIPQTYKISDCGGFDAATKADFAPTGYCDAEVLKWSYDAATGTLKLRDNRVLLNCCGDRTMTLVEKTDGSYEILEVDAPEAAAGGSRCNCMCVFDLTMEASAIAGGTIQVTLSREVTDSASGAETIWSGQIDLSKGSGDVVVDSTAVGFWCQP